MYAWINTICVQWLWPAAILMQESYKPASLTYFWFLQNYLVDISLLFLNLSGECTNLTPVGCVHSRNGHLDKSLECLSNWKEGHLGKRDIVWQAVWAHISNKNREVCRIWLHSIHCKSSQEIETGWAHSWMSGDGILIGWVPWMMGPDHPCCVSLHAMKI